MKSLTFALTFLVVLLAWGIAVEKREGEGARREAAQFAANARAARYSKDSLQARLAEALMQIPHVTDTVRQIITRAKTLRDSVMMFKTDTLLLERFVWKTDTVREKCTTCADLLDTIYVRDPEEQRATESYISLLQGEVGRMRAKQKRDALRARVGLFVGYGATRINDGTIRGGWQVGIGLRAWP